MIFYMALWNQGQDLLYHLYVTLRAYLDVQAHEAIFFSPWDSGQPTPKAPRYREHKPSPGFFFLVALVQTHESHGILGLDNQTGPQGFI